MTSQGVRSQVASVWFRFSFNSWSVANVALRPSFLVSFSKVCSKSQLSRCSSASRFPVSEPWHFSGTCQLNRQFFLLFCAWFFQSTSQIPVWWHCRGPRRSGWWWWSRAHRWGRSSSVQIQRGPKTGENTFSLEKKCVKYSSVIIHRNRTKTKDKRHRQRQKTKTKTRTQAGEAESKDEEVQEPEKTLSPWSRQVSDIQMLKAIIQDKRQRQGQIKKTKDKRQKTKDKRQKTKDKR